MGLGFINLQHIKILKWPLKNKLIKYSLHNLKLYFITKYLSYYVHISINIYVHITFDMYGCMYVYDIKCVDLSKYKII